MCLSLAGDTSRSFPPHYTPAPSPAQNGFLYSHWSQSATAADSVPTPAEYSHAAHGLKIGSFSVRRPETEQFIGGWLEKSEDILLRALPAENWLENETKQALRDKLFFNQDTDYDFSEWLAARRESAIRDLTTGSADYLTDYFVGMTEDGAERLSFVRNIEWDYQSELGDRRWQTGLSALGALRETNDDAIVWQLRGYAAEESSAGANVGLIYRRAVDNILLGANIFGDYEQYGDDNDSFLRWSFGAELRSAWLDIFANRYEAITDGKKLENGEYLYTQSGYDAEVRLHAPQFRWVSGGLTYYKWEGEYGDDDDTGLRYNLAFDLFADKVSGLKLEVDLDSPDDGDLEWGGRIAYRHTFGAPIAGGGSYGETTFDPRAYFFSPVRREYTQRIRESGEGTEIVRAVLAAATAHIVIPEKSQTVTTTLTVASETAEFDSELSVTVYTDGGGILALSRGSRWALDMTPETTLAFIETGAALDFQGGRITLRREGELDRVVIDNVTVTLVGTRLILNYDPGSGGVADIVLNEGEIAYIIPPASESPPEINLLISTTVSGESAEAVVNEITVVGCAAPSHRRDEESYRTECFGDTRINFPAGASIVLESQGEVVTLSSGDGENITLRTPDGTEVVYTDGSYPFLDYDETTGEGFMVSVEMGAVTLTISTAHLGETEIPLAEDQAVGKTDDNGALDVPEGTTLTVTGEDGETRELGGALRFDTAGINIGSQLTFTVTQTVAVSGGNGNYEFALEHQDGADGILSVNEGGREAVLELTSPVTVSATYRLIASSADGSEAPATLLITARVTDRLLFRDDSPVSKQFLTDTTGALVTLRTLGGVGDLTYRFLTPPGAGRYALTPLNERVAVNVQTRRTSIGDETAIVEAATDGGGDSSLAEEATITIEIEFVRPLALAATDDDGEILRQQTESAPGAIATITATEGSRAYSFDISSVIPSSEAGKFAVAGAGGAGVISYTRQLPVGLVTIIVAVTDGLSPPQPFTLSFNVYDELVLALTGGRTLVLNAPVPVSVAHIAPNGGSRDYSATALISGSADYFDIDGAALRLTAALTGETRLTATVQVTDSDSRRGSATAELPVRVILPLEADLQGAPSGRVDQATGLANAGRVVVSGGSGGHSYTRSSNAANIDQSNGNISIPAGGSAGIHTVIFTVDDDERETPRVTPAQQVTLMFTVAAPVSFEDTGAFQVVTGTTKVYTPKVTGGAPDYDYALLGTNPPSFAANLDINTGTGEVTLSTPQSALVTATATIQVTDGFGETAVFEFVIDINEYSPLALALENRRTLIASEPLPVTVANLLASGGSGVYASYNLVGGDTNYFDISGLALIMTAAVTRDTSGLVAIVEVIDSDTGEGRATVTITVRVILPLTAELRDTPSGRVDPTFTGVAGRIVASGGSSSPLDYEQVAGRAEVQVDDTTGTISIAASLPPDTYTAIFTVDDDESETPRVTPAERLTMSFTVAHSVNFDRSDAFERININATGIIYTPTRTGGVPDYLYALAGTNPATYTANLRVNPETGQVTLVTPIATPVTMTGTIRVTDGFGETAVLALTIEIVERAPSFYWLQQAAAGTAYAWDSGWEEIDIRPASLRDAAAVVFNNRLWAFGGGSGSGTEQVWSYDGTEWERQAESGTFRVRRDAAAVVHNGKVIVLGGRDGLSSADVYASDDGVDWTRQSQSQISGRSQPALLSHDGDLWLIGGTALGSNLAEQQIYRSPDDGVTWQTVGDASDFPGGDSGRYHAAVRFDGKFQLYVSDNSTNGAVELWQSPDAENWTDTGITPGWSPRRDYGLVVHGGTLWMAGGNVNSEEYWYSLDGERWAKADDDLSAGLGASRLAAASALRLDFPLSQVTIAVAAVTLAASEGSGGYRYRVISGGFNNPVPADSSTIEPTSAPADGDELEAEIEVTDSAGATATGTIRVRYEPPRSARQVDVEARTATGRVLGANLPSSPVVLNAAGDTTRYALSLTVTMNTDATGQLGIWQSDRWTVDMTPATTLSFLEVGAKLSLHGGKITLEREGDLNTVIMGEVAVELLGTELVFEYDPNEGSHGEAEIELNEGRIAYEVPATDAPEIVLRVETESTDDVAVATVTDSSDDEVIVGCEALSQRWNNDEYQTNCAGDDTTIEIPPGGATIVLEAQGEEVTLMSGGGSNPVVTVISADGVTAIYEDGAYPFPEGDDFMLSVVAAEGEVTVVQATMTVRATVGETFTEEPEPVVFEPVADKIEIDAGRIGVIATVKADGGLGTISYALGPVTPSAAADSFAVDAASGEVRVTAALAGQQGFRVEVIAEATGDGTRGVVELMIETGVAQGKLYWLDLGGGDTASEQADDSAVGVLVLGESGWTKIVDKPAPYVGNNHYVGAQAAQLGGTLWLFGGDPARGSGSEHDAWYYDTATGGDWQNQASDYSNSAREGVGLSHNGSLYLFHPNLATPPDAAGSADGINWGTLNNNIDFRENHVVISDGVTLWMMGGQTYTDNYEADYSILWSTDGRTWTDVNVVTPFGGNSGRGGGAYLRGTLWFYGDDDGNNQWYSADGGVNWTRSTAETPPWSSSRNIGVAVLDDKIYLADRNEAWVSEDGENWQSAGRVPAGAGTYRRSDLLAVPPPGGDRFTGAELPLRLSFVSAKTAVASPPPAMQVALLDGRGGDRAHTYTPINGSENLFAVAGNALNLTATYTVAATLTATVRLTDGSGTTPAVAELSLQVVPQLTAVLTNQLTRVAVGYRGAVANITASGGDGNYQYAKLSGADVLSVSPSGAIQVAHTIGIAEGVFRVTDGSGSGAAVYLDILVTVADQLAFTQVNDQQFAAGATGELVTVVAAGGFGAGGGAGTVMYDIGGVSPAAATNIFTVNAASGVVSVTTALASGQLFEVTIIATEENSGDRAELALRVEIVSQVAGGALFWMNDAQGNHNVFRLNAAKDGWEAIASRPNTVFDEDYTPAEFGGTLWIFGGYDQSDSTDRIWSYDIAGGTTWVDSGTTEEIVDSAGAVVHGSSLFLMGGLDEDGNTINDIWRSGDGTTWHLVPKTGDRWEDRAFPAVLSNGGTLWVMGSDSNSDSNRNDVWYSTDNGESWIKKTQISAYPSTGERKVATYFNDEFCLYGLESDNTGRQYCSSDAATWTQRSPEWGGRAVPGVAELNGVLYLAGGGSNADSWISSDGQTWSKLATVSVDMPQSHLIAQQRSAVGGGQTIPGAGVPLYLAVSDAAEVVQTPPPARKVADLAGRGGAGGYSMTLINGSDEIFVIDGAALSLTAVYAAATDLTATVRLTDSASGTAVEEIALRVVPPIVAALTDHRTERTAPTDRDILLARVQASGGSGGLHYSRPVSAADVIVEPDGRIMLTASLAVGSYRVSVVVDDDETAGATQPVLLVLEFSVDEQVSFNPAADTAGYAIETTGDFYTATPQDGKAPFQFTIIGTNPAGFAGHIEIGETSGVLGVTAVIPATQQATVTIQVTDVFAEMATLILSIDIIEPFPDTAGLFWMQRDGEKAFVLNDELGLWVEMAARPTLLYDFAPFLFEGTLFAIGGRTNNGNGNTALNSGVDEIWFLSYDSANSEGGEWKESADTLEATRHSGGAVVNRGALFYIGGRGPTSPARSTYRSTNGETWTAISSGDNRINPARFGMAAAGNNAELRIFGGYTGNSGDNWNQDMSSSPDGTVWTTRTQNFLPDGVQNFTNGGYIAAARFNGKYHLFIRNNDGVTLYTTSDGSALETVGSPDWRAEQAEISNSDFGVAVYDGLLWVAGGGKIKYTRDGVTWRDGPDLGQSAGDSFLVAAEVPTAAPALSFPPETIILPITGDPTLTVVQLAATGGDDSAYTFATGSDSFAVVDDVLLLTAISAAGSRLTATVTVTDDSGVTASGEIVVEIAAAAPVAGVWEVASRRIEPGYSGAFGRIDASGGYGGYTYARVAGATEIEVGNDGGITLASSLAVGLYTVQIGVEDRLLGDAGSDDTPGARVTLEFLVGDKVQFKDGDTFAYAEIAAETAGAVWTAMGEQGIAPYQFRRVRARDGIGDFVTVYADGVVSVSVTSMNGRSGRIDVEVTDANSETATLVLTVQALFAKKSDLFWMQQLSPGTRHYNPADGGSWVDIDSRPNAAAGGPIDYPAFLFRQGTLWAFGGQNNAGDTSYDEIWSFSESGWTYHGSGAFGARSEAKAVVHDDKMFIIGGWRDDDNDTLNDVWSSTNGTVWTEVTGSAEFSARKGMGLLSHSGSIYLIGGFQTDTTSSNRRDVWRSVDGALWTRVIGHGDDATFGDTGGSFIRQNVRYDFKAVSFNNRFYLYETGLDTAPAGYVRNVEWYSDDAGETWVSGQNDAAIRPWHENGVVGIASYRGQIWAAGAYTADNSPAEIWVSGDGATWAERAELGGGWVDIYTELVAPPPPELRLRVVGTARATVAATETLPPVTLATLRAEDGDGSYTYAGGSEGVTVVDDNVLVLNTLPDESTTLTVVAEVTDGSGAFARTQFFVHVILPISARAEAIRRVDPGSVDIVIGTIIASNGVPPYQYARVSGTSALTVLSDGAVSVVSALSESTSARFRVTDSAGSTADADMTLVAGQKVQFESGITETIADIAENAVGAVWTARGESGIPPYQFSVIGVEPATAADFLTLHAGGVVSVSAVLTPQEIQITLAVTDDAAESATLVLILNVYEELSSYMFAFGDTIARNYNNAASNWRTIANRPLSANDGSVLNNVAPLVHRGTLWTFGGNDGDNGGGNEIWFFANGRWQFGGQGDFAHAGWMRAVVHLDKMFLLGGLSEQGGDYLNDVWESTNGFDWELAKAAAFPVRYNPVAFSHAGSLWLMSGQFNDAVTDISRNDVWRSADGKTWVQVIADGAGFSTSAPPVDNVPPAFERNRNNADHLAGVFFDGKYRFYTQSDSTTTNNEWVSDDGATWSTGNNVGTSRTWQPTYDIDAAVYQGTMWAIGRNSAVNNRWQDNRLVAGGDWSHNLRSAGWLDGNRGYIVAEAASGFAIRTNAVVDFVNTETTAPVTIAELAPLGVTEGAFFTFSTDTEDFSIVAKTLLVLTAIPDSSQILTATVQLASGTDRATLELAVEIFAPPPADERLFWLSDESGNEAIHRFTGSSWTEIRSRPMAANYQRFAPLYFDNKLWLIGGRYGSGTPTNEVWSYDVLTDGWTQVRANGDPSGFVSVTYARAAVLGNEMLLLGGNDGTNDVNNVYASADGIRWTAKSVPPWSARERFAVASTGSTVWIFAEFGVRDDDVWWTTDGSNWRGGAPAAGHGYPRTSFTSQGAESAAVLNGTLFLHGGAGGAGAGRQDWQYYSTDRGLYWTAAADAAWSGRQDHGATQLGGTLFLAGGNFDGTADLGLWFSTDGLNWSVTSSVAAAQGSSHLLSPLTPTAADTTIDDPALAFSVPALNVDIGQTGDTARLAASGGAGTYTYELINAGADPGYAIVHVSTVEAVLSVTTAVESPTQAVATIRVTDNARNSETALLRINYRVAPRMYWVDRDGVTPYVYQYIPRDDSWVTVTRLPDVTEGDDTGPMRAYVAAQFNGKLFFIGGNVRDADRNYPSTSKMVIYDILTETWTESDAAPDAVAGIGGQLVTHLGKMFFFDREGIWQITDDGDTWTPVLDHGLPALRYASAFSDGKGIWVLGGSINGSDVVPGSGLTSGLQTDTWYSSDGTAWRRAETTTPYRESRFSAYRGAAFYQNKLWIHGDAGATSQAAQWSSADGGKTWARETATEASLPWKVVDYSGVAVFEGTPFFAGGYHCFYDGTTPDSGPCYSDHTADEAFKYDGTSWTTAGTLNPPVFIGSDNVGIQRALLLTPEVPAGDGVADAELPPVPPLSFAFADMTATVTNDRGKVTELAATDGTQPYTWSVIGDDSDRFEIIGDVLALSGALPGGQVPAILTAIVVVSDANDIAATATLAVVVESMAISGMPSELFWLQRGHVNAHVYNPSGSGSWVRLPSRRITPVGNQDRTNRDFAPLFHQGTIWALGGAYLRALSSGVSAASDAGVNTIEYYDIAQGIHGAWQSASNAGSQRFSKRKNAMAVTHNTTMFIIGGSDGNDTTAGRTLLRDVWSSTNGTVWTQIATNEDAVARQAAAVVSHDGYIWLFGGMDKNFSRVGSIYRSADGVDWEQVSITSGDPLGENRRFFAAQFFDGAFRLFIGSTSSFATNGEVWASTDGAAWTERSSQINGNRRDRYYGLAKYDGRLWRAGGSNTDQTNSRYKDRWRTGADWNDGPNVASGHVGGNSYLVAGEPLAADLIPDFTELPAAITVTLAEVSVPHVLATLEATVGTGSVEFELDSQSGIYLDIDDSQGVTVLRLLNDGIIGLDSFTAEIVAVNATNRARARTTQRLPVLLVGQLKVEVATPATTLRAEQLDETLLISGLDISGAATEENEVVALLGTPGLFAINANDNLEMRGNSATPATFTSPTTYLTATVQVTKNGQEVVVEIAVDVIQEFSGAFAPVSSDRRLTPTANVVIGTITSQGGFVPYVWTPGGEVIPVYLPAGSAFQVPGGGIKYAPTEAGMTVMLTLANEVAFAIDDNGVVSVPDPDSLNADIMTETTTYIEYAPIAQTVIQEGGSEFTITASVVALFKQETTTATLSVHHTGLAAVINENYYIIDSGNSDIPPQTMTVTIAATLAHPVSLTPPASGSVTVRLDAAGVFYYSQLFGGIPDYTWAISGATTGFTINATTGAIGLDSALATPLAAGTRQIVIAVTDGYDESATMTITFDVRAAAGSSTNVGLFLLNRAKPSGESAAMLKRNSANTDWTAVAEIPAGAPQEFAVAQFKGYLWLLGGNKDVVIEDIFGDYQATESTNEIWRYRIDGDYWELFRSNDGAAVGRFTPRADAQAVVHDGTMFLMGGYHIDAATIHASHVTDVWATADGANWAQTAADAFPGRNGFPAFSDGVTMWVFDGVGGIDEDAAADRDVWRSTDGASWTEVEINGGVRNFQGYEISLSLDITGGSPPVTTTTTLTVYTGEIIRTVENRLTYSEADFDKRQAALIDGNMCLFGSQQDSGTWCSQDQGVTWAPLFDTYAIQHERINLPGEEPVTMLLTNSAIPGVPHPYTLTLITNKQALIKATIGMRAPWLADRLASGIGMAKYGDTWFISDVAGDVWASHANDGINWSLSETDVAGIGHYSYLSAPASSTSPAVISDATPAPLLWAYTDLESQGEITEAVVATVDSPEYVALIEASGGNGRFSYNLASGSSDFALVALYTISVSIGYSASLPDGQTGATTAIVPRSDVTVYALRYTGTGTGTKTAEVRVESDGVGQTKEFVVNALGALEFRNFPSSLIDIDNTDTIPALIANLETNSGGEVDYSFECVEDTEDYYTEVIGSLHPGNQGGSQVIYRYPCLYPDADYFDIEPAGIGMAMLKLTASIEDATAPVPLLVGASSAGYLEVPVSELSPAPSSLPSEITPEFGYVQLRDEGTCSLLERNNPFRAYHSNNQGILDVGGVDYCDIAIGYAADSLGYTWTAGSVSSGALVPTNGPITHIVPITATDKATGLQTKATVTVRVTP